MSAHFALHMTACREAVTDFGSTSFNMAFAFAQASRDCATAGRAPLTYSNSSHSHLCLQHFASAAVQITPPAAAGEAGWGDSRTQQPLRRRLTACCSSRSSGGGIRNLRASAASQPQYTAIQPQQQPIRIALGTTSAAAATAIVSQLQVFRSSEVWATSAANHFTAIQALAEAQKQLAGQQQSLAAVASLSASDQEIVDDQKRGLKKLTLQLQLCDTALDEAVWAADAASHISTNRTKSVADLVQAMQSQFGQHTSSGGDGAAVVLQARGEQAVTRALKALLSLQASQQGSLLLRPWQGQVVDVVAEKKGEQRLAGGLLLHASWSS